jgi:hypothetical protein
MYSKGKHNEIVGSVYVVSYVYELVVWLFMVLRFVRCLIMVLGIIGWLMVIYEIA